MEKLFNVVKRGYDQDEVDHYINTLEDHLNSYKDKDDSIKNAIINAQISADNIIKNAEIEAERIKKRAVNLLDDIHKSIGSQKQITRDFQGEYTALLAKYLHPVNTNDVNKVMGKLDELEQYLVMMQETHNSKLADDTQPATLPKMVAGLSHGSRAEQPVAALPEQSTADNKQPEEEDNETVALVAELLAKDKPNN